MTTLITLPSEVLEKILGHLPLVDNSLLNASLVHPTLLAIIRSSTFWRQFYPTKTTPPTTAPTFTTIHSHTQNRPDAWLVHHAAIKHRLFSRNLVKNASGEDGLTHWTLLSGEATAPDETPHRTGWTVVKSADAPFLTYFSTDHHSCSKEQSVDLWASGLSPAVMRAIVPFRIRWGVSTSTPTTNSGGFYDLQIRFLSQNHDDIFLDQSDMTQSHTLPPGQDWTHFGGSFNVRTGKEEYLALNSGLRFVHFYHGGMAKGNEPGEGVRIREVGLWVELLT